MPKEVSLKEFFSNLPLTDKILVSLLTAGAIAEEALDTLYKFSPRAVTRSLYTSEDLNHIKKDNNLIRNALLRLAGKKLIEIEKREKERVLKLTETGLTTLFSKFPQIKFKNWGWDGQWRVIIYDIEEETRRLRDKLRSTLRSLGFNLVQKSVWFSPYPVEEELEAFLKKENIWKKIMIFKSTLKKSDSKKLIENFYPNLKVKWSTLPKK